MHMYKSFLDASHTITLTEMFNFFFKQKLIWHELNYKEYDATTPVYM